jgi:predicted nucleotide-binding protein (sugar kinase/HSP70/actin superfamily)
MKITFPHFGNAYIAFKTAADAIGLEYVVPPRPSKRAIDSGSKLSPETICLPFKVNMGNLIEALESGADTIAFAGGVGPCRFGYYGKGIEMILKDRGYDFKILHLNQRDVPEAYRILKKANCPKFSFRNFIWGFLMMWQKAKSVAEAEHLKRRWLPYAIRKSDVHAAFDEGIKLIDEAKSVKELRRTRAYNKKQFKKILKDLTKRPLKIGIIGEIYMVLEPYVNMNLEEKLTDMEVETHTMFSMHKWMKYIFHLDLFGKRSFRNLAKRARPYLRENAGGESQNNIGSAILYSEEGYDGVIHIYPFTCMPGLVGHTILNKVSKDRDIPILNFSIDEHASEVGFKTRLEAFVDLLKKRRDEKDAVFSRN